MKCYFLALINVFRVTETFSHHTRGHVDTYLCDSVGDSKHLVLFFFVIRIKNRLIHQQWFLRITAEILIKF